MGGFFTKMFSKLSGKKEIKIIIIGLDNSGKTTILSKIFSLIYRQIAFE
jgi:ADP-ribosylation factor-like protein 1